MAAHVAKQAAARASRPAVSAGVPILAAKITAPGVPDWAVPRPRITMLIAQGSRWHRLTVVTAPAGAGKTMALASGAAAEPGAVAWVGLDGYGNQPKAFWAYVVAALRRSGMALRTAPPIMRGRDAGHVFLLWLAAALAAQDPPVTLVLDDLHLMTDPEVLDGLDYVLRNVGPGLRLVVSGRMVPLPLHRYRLAGDLTEIRAGDLAFTTAEAGLLLARHGITLTADSLEHLTRRTEGWAAGLRPAAISLRRGSPPSPPSSSSSDVMYPAPVTSMSVPPHRAPGGADAGGDRQLSRPGSAKSERMRSSNPGRGLDSSMSSAPAAGDQPFGGPSARVSTALVTRWLLRLLPSVKALGGADAASRSGSA